MADVLTMEQRSYNMSRIRSANTGPELRLREILVENKFDNFNLHPENISGRPDFYFQHEKLAIFLDGCFWHACGKCFKMPATNKKFWKEKIRKNIVRDKKVNRLLNHQGIKVLRVREHELKASPDKVVNMIREKLSATKAPKILDLFAGAGGLSEGFIRAGCEIVGHIEMNKDACDTLVTRMVYHALLKMGKFQEYKNYVLGKTSRGELIKKYGLYKERDSVVCAKINKDNYKELINNIKTRLDGGNIDIIVGGPPCQAYSHIGRARDQYRMSRDNRNYLYKYYISFLKALKPKLFIFENVPGLKSAGNGKYLYDMRRLAKAAGYETDYRIINAVNFGVPQNRKRIILVGWNNKSKLKSYPPFPLSENKYIAKDFFNDLPKIQSGGGKNIIKKYSVNNNLLVKLDIKSKRFDILMDHVARPNTKHDLLLYKLAAEAREAGCNIKYTDFPEKLKTHKNVHGFLDRFKVVNLNDKGSHTVVAHIAKDGHYYIHPDIAQNRSLTVREAARLQTFPDDYKFEGSRTSQFRQIGNAVPPLLSTVIAKEIIKYV